MSYRTRRRDPIDTENPVFFKVEFRGLITHVVPRGDYGFIGISTITRLDGQKDLGISAHRDLRLHVRKNPSLGDPLHAGIWITFILGPDKGGQEGIEVYDAKRAP